MTQAGPLTEECDGGGARHLILATWGLDEKDLVVAAASPSFVARSRDAAHAACISPQRRSLQARLTPRLPPDATPFVVFAVRACFPRSGDVPERGEESDAANKKATDGSLHSSPEPNRSGLGPLGSRCTSSSQSQLEAGTPGVEPSTGCAEGIEAFGDREGARRSKRISFRFG
ncbi:hypothetical protein MTO96_008316 [Rhipicephalus appendiculatus]